MGQVEKPEFWYKDARNVLDAGGRAGDLHPRLIDLNHNTCTGCPKKMVNKDFLAKICTLEP